MLEMAFAGFLGILLGIFTGILPGLHINTVVSILAVLSIKIEPIITACFLVSLSISHNFFEFIPAALFSAPKEGECLISRPSRKFVNEGKGRIPMKLSAIGALFSTIIFLFFVPFYVFILPILSSSIKNYIPFILLAVSLSICLKEDKKITAFLLFILSGILGYFTLDVIKINEPMLPLLSGLFGLSGVYGGIKNKEKIPNQMKIYGNNISKKEIIKGSLSGIFASSLMGVVPAIGPSQASLFLSSNEKKSIEEFFVSTGAVNTADVLMSITALYSINKARSGALEFVKSILSLGLSDVFILIFFSVLSAFASYFIFIKISDIFADNISKIRINRISLFILFFLIILITCISGLLGLFIAFLGSALGYLCSKKDVRMSNLMGCLVVPTIIFYIKFLF